MFGNKEFCPFCGVKLGLGKYRTKENIAICPICAKTLAVNHNVIPQQTINCLAERWKERMMHLEVFQSFNAYREAVAGGMYFRADDKLKMWYASKEKKPKHPVLFRFDEIVNVELKEDGNTVTNGGGIGRSVVGGLLFGGAGAIAGGLTSSKTSKKEIFSLDIIITLRNAYCNSLVVKLLTFGKCKSGDMTYNICMNAAKELGAFLEAIVKSNDSTPQPPNPPSSPLSSTDTQQDPMEQIVKYKELLDKGIIDEVEFKRKKKELLGL